MQSNILFGDEARKRLIEGIDLAADAVEVTLGVSGRNGILDPNEYERPTNTNDGYTILRDIKLRDPFQNIGLKYSREVAERVNDEAGDATSTSVSLFRGVVKEGARFLDSGTDATAIRRGIEKACTDICENIKHESSESTNEDTLAAVATISVGNEKLGEIIGSAVFESGVDGLITIEDNNGTETIPDRAEGIKVRGGFNIPNFVNVPKFQQAQFEDIPVFVTNQNVSTAEEIKRLMDAALALKQDKIVLFANAIEGDALLTAIRNYEAKKFFILPIRVVAYGDMGEGVLRDIAAVTNAKFFDGAAGSSVSSVTKDDLGKAEKIVASKDTTTVVASDSSARDARVTELEAMIESTDKEFERESLRERVAKLKNALIAIKVGGSTDTVRKEKRLRIEDAVNTTQNALKTGVVTGGGSCLYRNSRLDKLNPPSDEDEARGYLAVVRACEVPIRRMAKNSAVEIDKSSLDLIISSTNLAYDFKLNSVVDAFKAGKSGVLDSTRAEISALTNACTQAALLLVTELVVIPLGNEVEEEL